MEEKTILENTTEESEKTGNEATPEDRKQEAEAFKKKMQEIFAERKAREKEANEAIAAGKGRFNLETPILAGDNEIKELTYDFTALTGMEYADAMDSDPNANQAFKITYRQALALFARAAAKQTERVDTRDIIERMGVTDAVEAVNLATLFFSVSARAGRLRISKA